ncbi:MAG: metallophosphoesterase family protein [Sandaracinaceae bacterium]
MPEHPGGRGPAAATIAFLSDIHGNLEALDAVLEELSRRDVSTVFVAGDLLLGGADPVGVYQRLQQVGARCTRGLSDSALVRIEPKSLVPANDADRARAEAYAATRASLGDLILKYLERLPEKLRLPLVDGREVLMVHGSPRDPTLEISHDLDDEELRALVDDDPADFIVCGASHVPFQREVTDGQTVINVGSVGEAPGARVAHYTLLTPRLDGAVIEQSFVEY